MEKQLLEALYRKHTGIVPDQIVRLPGSGSNRHYYRIGSGKHSVVGVFNAGLKENIAFISFTESLSEAGFPVPELLIKGEEGLTYLLHDLGDVTLFSMLTGQRTGATISGEVMEQYRKVIKWLPRIQTEGGRLIRFDDCYPRPAFDGQSMQWDLNYFKYYFLKLSGSDFNEQALENDFQDLTAFLLEAPGAFFLYRDFQSRNIMIYQGAPWFIDYQGGRKGALPYDVASLLYDAKADLPDEFRAELLDLYLQELEIILPGMRTSFLRFYPGFILIRILQALGAYGFRGYYERKNHFLQSIPYALGNLKQQFQTWPSHAQLPALPELRRVLGVAIESPVFSGHHAETTGLTVTIFSFSYKSGLPVDDSGNGGGFVFDCRALPNPGRYDEYRELTGRDQAVISFLEREPEVEHFLGHVAALVDASVTRYLRRDFRNLSVAFGCTGGRHRSVYAAEAFARHLRSSFPVNVVLKHLNPDIPKE